MSIDTQPHFRTPTTETHPSVEYRSVSPELNPAIPQHLGLDALQLMDLADGHLLAARAETRNGREGASLGHSLRSKQLGRRARELDRLYGSYAQDTVAHPDIDPITPEDSWDD